MIDAFMNGVAVNRLLHEKVGRSAKCIVWILVHGRCGILRRSRQMCRNLIRVEVAVNRMEWQIASRLAPTLRWRACVAVWSMNHLPIGTSRRLAHWAAVSHNGTVAPCFMWTLATHDRSRGRASGDKQPNRPRKHYSQFAMHRIHSLVFPKTTPLRSVQRSQRELNSGNTTNRSGSGLLNENHPC